jgi:hypothetical protein
VAQYVALARRQLIGLLDAGEVEVRLQAPGNDAMVVHDCDRDDAHLDL